jgi:glucoside 3-dehydrogenase (cytochrome c) hitch-hiker subunit
MSGQEDLFLDRRALLERAIFLVGGATALSLGACAPKPGGPFFSAAQMGDLDIVTDIIIPETDTPGARGVGVPAFMESMMVNWASKDTRARYTGVLGAINERARADHGKSLAELEATQQLETVRAFDADNVHAESGDYRDFKELVLLGYYNSEIGATQELRYVLVPGAWRADIPFSDIGRAWAA